MLDQVPQKVKLAADAGSWGAVLIGWFSDWSPVLTGTAAILAGMWTTIQIYEYFKRKFFS